MLIIRGAPLPSGLGYLAFLSAAPLVLVYIGRFVILDPKDPVLLIAAVAVGFVVNPIWLVWLGLVLRRSTRLHQKPVAVEPCHGRGHVGAPVCLRCARPSSER